MIKATPSHICLPPIGAAFLAFISQCPLRLNSFDFYNVLYDVKPHGARSRGRGEDREGASCESAKGKSREQGEENSIGHRAWGMEREENFSEFPRQTIPLFPLWSRRSRHAIRSPYKHFFEFSKSLRSLRALRLSFLQIELSK